jgi:endogenous inhibitor of DNA gyrase (YacG/DUF329 family)
MSADDPDDKSSDGKEQPAVTGRAKACPNCGKPVKLETRPFCSKRCADIDLGRWLGEAYRIPAEEPPDGHDAEAASPQDEEPNGR